MSAPPIEHVVIGDPSPVEAIGLATILRRAAHCNKVTAVQDWPSLVWSVKPDVDMILIDVDLPGYVGPADIDELRCAAPSAHIALLTSHSITAVTPLLDVGVRGFIPKQLAADDLIAALRVVASGQIYLPAATWDAMKLERSEHDKPRAARFSDRQQQVLTLAAEGCSNKEIGAKLNISESTVKVHISAVLRILGVTSRGRAVAVFSSLKAKNGSAFGLFSMLNFNATDATIAGPMAAASPYLTLFY